MSVQSIKFPHEIETSGFEHALSIQHMIEWLRRDSGFPGFVVNDAEEEVYAQDQSGRLISVRCGESVSCQTTLRRTAENLDAGLVTDMAIIFPLTLEVIGGNGVTWIIDVSAAYHASGMDTSNNYRLRFDFDINEARLSG